jgi:hypothetical protein
MKFRGSQASLGKAGGATTLRMIYRRGKHLLIVAICVSSCAITGCIESTWTLASESKLPKSLALPPGLTRKDVLVTLNLYTPLRGPDAKFELRDTKGKKLAVVKGVVKHTGLNYNEIIVVNGITEEVALKPYREHENMELNGTPVALFYVVDDDPCLRREVLEGGLPMCPKNGMNQYGMDQNAVGCPCLLDPK